MATKPRLTICVAVALSWLLPLCALGSRQDACPEIFLQAEQLPNLNIPRSGHYVYCINHEVTVFGGHTSGFVPTPTAEYYSQGEWHLVNMTYSHDQGLVFPMKSGKTIAVGGHEQPLGIGQTFTLELYDAATHDFEGYGCLENKRCFASALELDSGKVLITGNWYHPDAMEVFNGSRQNLLIKEVSQNRSLPYVLRTARDNAIVFSDQDYHANRFDTIIVDRLHGEPFTVPLFEEWRPFHILNSFINNFIGDEDKGEYAYLLTAFNSSGQMGIVKVAGEEFSLLSTDHPVPMKSQWGPISYISYVIADRQAGRAYVVAHGNGQDDTRLYVLSIEYEHTPARLTLYYTDPLGVSGYIGPGVLTPEGHLMLVGGLRAPTNNFEPHGLTFLLHLGRQETDQASSGWGGMLLLLLVALILAALVTWIVLKRRTKKADIANNGDFIGDFVSDEVLMGRICRLMDEEKLYLNSDLKIADVADRLGTNVSYVSACINSQRGCSFIQFVNEYRVECAKQLLRQNPDMKIAAVSTASGFTAESSLFRNFKAIEGKTPKEWVAGLTNP
ncbi:MAG: helix-turn-helix transcriptional regulator [Prevotella sp.]|nr:helix-turn-helix transcriptional regulator [Prevotella sp.]